MGARNVKSVRVLLPQQGDDTNTVIDDLVPEKGIISHLIVRAHAPRIRTPRANIMIAIMNATEIVRPGLEVIELKRFVFRSVSLSGLWHS